MKLKEILTLIFNDDQYFFFKLKNIFVKNIVDVLSYLKENMNYNLNQLNKNSSNDFGLEHDRIYLIILTKCYKVLMDNIDIIQSFLIEEFHCSTMEQKQEIFSETNKLIKNEMNKNIQLIINKCLNHAINETNMNSFIMIYLSLLDVTNNYFSYMKMDPLGAFAKFENGKINYLINRVCISIFRS